ncbi:MAG: DUF935 family protein [Nitrospiraceae bacterium]|nr:DUF935 family protein [Nitrospiraceae bacterium]
MKTRPVLDEIAGARNDISLFGDFLPKNVLRNPDRLLRSTGKGIGLYEELLYDPQVRACLQTRKLAVVGREWEVVPGGGAPEDARIADFVKEALLAFDFDSARTALLSAVVLGFKTAEIMWEYSEGSVWIREMAGRASSRFRFDAAGNLRLLTPGNMFYGGPVPERKFQVFRYGGENGSPYGDGLGASLYWPVWFKKNALRFWMVFAEKFGSPTVIGKYPPGTPREHQDALMGALEAIQQESAIKIPETMRIELLEAQRSGAVNTYDTLCAFLNGEIAKLLLGQTLTTEIGQTGSYAASRTHNEVRMDYIKADADLLSGALNRQLVRWLVDFNFPAPRPASRYPKLWIRQSGEEDLKALAERDALLLKMGVKIPARYFYGTYGLPEPADGEETL